MKLYTASQAPSIASASTAAAAGPRQLRLWHSPLPFLFGGMAVAILLIAVALLVLFCTNHLSSSSSNNNDVEKAAAQPSMMARQMEEPKFVVVMAGNDVPTYIAKPVTTAAISAEVLHREDQLCCAQ